LGGPIRNNLKKWSRNENWPNNIHGFFFKIYFIITKKITKKLFLCVSYIFSKFDGPWKNEGVTFLVVPPNCTHTRLKLVSRKQSIFFLILCYEPKQGDLMKATKLMNIIQLSFLCWMCWNLIIIFKFPICWAIIP
jgi:hypothetical protein